MTNGVSITGVGAVTPAGLTASQTVAALRAGLSGLSEIAAMPSPHAAVIGGRVPASSSLRRTYIEWLVNLAARAAMEALGDRTPRERVALLMATPDASRDEPNLSHSTADLVLNATFAKAAQTWHDGSRAYAEGRAGIGLALRDAQSMLASGQIDACLVGGVDSLVGRADCDRFRHSHRLASPDCPQGLHPGEGAAFICLERRGDGSREIAHLLGVGVATETHHVLSERFSSGIGLCRAIDSAIEGSAMSESAIDWRVSDMNGERYAAIESVLAAARSYRTRRERLHTVFPAASTGDLGAAAGALGIVCGVVLGRHPASPGPIVICESGSDNGLRSATILSVPRSSNR